MSDAVKSIENAVEQLGRNDLAVFREWFSTFDAAEWDAQIERDICAGKLDSLAEDFDIFSKNGQGNSSLWLRISISDDMGLTFLRCEFIRGV